MAQCQRCGHENILELPICKACYALLPGTALLVGDSAAGLRQALERQRQQAHSHLQHLGLLDGQSFAIYVAAFERPLIVQVKHELLYTSVTIA